MYGLAGNDRKQCAYEIIPTEPTPALTAQGQKSLETLKRLLDGEFKEGLGPMSNLYRD